MQLGENLRRLRESKKLSLEKIANQTKININFLVHMEGGRFDYLPELFVRNFLKVYVKELGKDAHKILVEYDAIISRGKEKTDTLLENEVPIASSPKKAPDSFGKIRTSVEPYLRQKKFIWLGVGLVCVTLILFSLINGDTHQSAYISDSTGTALGNTIHKNNLDTSAMSVASKLFSINKKLSLEVKTIEKTWVQIAVDDSAAKDYIFDTGSNANWEAEEKYLLRVGNGGGIRLYLNGVDLGQLGQKGEVVTLLLNKDGIQSSSL